MRRERLSEKCIFTAQCTRNDTRCMLIMTNQRIMGIAESESFELNAKDVLYIKNAGDETTFVGAHNKHYTVVLRPEDRTKFNEKALALDEILNG